MHEEYTFVNALFNDYHLDVENINLALDIFSSLGMEKVELFLYKNNLDASVFTKIRNLLNSFNIWYEIRDSKDSFYDGLEYEFYYNDILIANGGRHDYLTKKLSAPELPSSSITFDIDELKNIIEYTSLVPQMEEELDFLVISTDNDYDSSFIIASRLRELGVKVDINYNDYDPSRLRDYIDRMNIPYTIMTNQEDVNKGIVTVRNSISKEEGNVYFEQFLEELIEHSKHHHS